MKPLLAVICLACAAFAQTEQHQFPQAGDSYVIARGDVVLVLVWKNPDLTNTLPVNAKGMISMPLLNDVQAAGKTPMELAASIMKKLKQYIEDPHVTVVVAEMNGKWVCGAAPCAKGQRPKIRRTPMYSIPQNPWNPRLLEDFPSTPDGIIFKG